MKMRGGKAGALKDPLQPWSKTVTASAQFAVSP